jgi:hypothetical protein
MSSHESPIQPTHENPHQEELDKVEATENSRRQLEQLLQLQQQDTERLRREVRECEVVGERLQEAVTHGDTSAIREMRRTGEIFREKIAKLKRSETALRATGANLEAVQLELEKQQEKWKRSVN